MPIDMSNYKMIYKDLVFNVVCVMPIVYFAERNTPSKITNISATVVDEDGTLQILNDEAFMFKFVRR